jgi:beta-lactam-binding protein with PASTA domain
MVQPGTGVIVTGGNVQVPSLIGLDGRSAAHRLRQYRLNAGEVRYTADRRLAQVVVAQNPPAGTQVAVGSYVSYTLGLQGAPPPQETIVPNLVGMSEDQAKAALQRIGLTLGPVEWKHASQASGTVISQNPVSNSRVAPGAPVSFVLSAGPEIRMIPVPSVVGLALASAELQLTTFGLRVGTISKAFSDRVPVNSVISQDPQAGARIEEGGAVNLVIAAQRPRPRVRVPNLVGLQKNQAIEMLRRSGLSVGTIEAVPSAAHPVGQVMEQVPAARTNVFRGSAVNLTVSDGPRMVLVPNLVNMTIQAATQVLQNAGLHLGTVGKQIVPGGTGLILNHNPGAGYRVAEGTAVNVTLGVAPAGLPVPGVIGLSLDQARTSLTQAGLQMGTITRRDPGPAAIENNTVLDQSPATGSYLPRGGRGNVTIAWHDPKSVRVPNLRGLRYRDAIQQLSNKRLKVGRVDHRTVTGAQVGKVSDQNPSANTRVWEGTSVNLVVGVKKREKLVHVPACLLLSENRAVKLIKSKGLVPKVNKVAGIPRGRVIFQFPPPATPVKRGSEVRIHVTR